MPKNDSKIAGNPSRKDDFESVAKRLGCNPDIKTFDAKMKKIAKAKTKSKATR
jgi:hypothetical protein